MNEEKKYNVVLTEAQIKKIWEMIDEELKSVGVSGLASCVEWHNSLTAAKEVVADTTPTPAVAGV